MGDGDKQPVDRSRPNWDEAAFVANWRAALPQLRRLVRRFGVSEDGVEDVLNEVGVRLFVKRENRTRLTEFVRLADAYARNVARDEKRRSDRRVEGLTTAEFNDAEDERDRVELGDVELRALVQSLTPAHRRALALMLRGGPYTNAERAVMHRGRSGLRTLFEGFDGLAAAVGIRWWRVRERLEGMRSLLGDPSPAVPALAALVTAATVGGYYAADASVERSSRQVPPGVHRKLVLPGHDHTRVGVVAARQSPRPDAHASTPTGGRAAPSVDTRAHPAVAATATTRLPRPAEDGEAGVTVEEPGSGREGWASVLIHDCDTPSQSWRYLCRTVSTAPVPR